MASKEKKKTTKHVWTLAEKLEIIKLRDEGASWVKIAQEKKTNESSIRTIYKNKDRILSQGKIANLKKYIPLLPSVTKLETGFRRL